MVVPFAGRVAYQHYLARSVEPLGTACIGIVSCEDLYSDNYVSQGQHLLYHRVGCQQKMMGLFNSPAQSPTMLMLRKVWKLLAIIVWRLLCRRYAATVCVGCGVLAVAAACWDR